MEITKDIHQIPGPRWSNAYLLTEPESLTLIDAGLPGNRRNILDYIERIGRRPQELQRVVLTHSHPDHTGPLRGLSQDTGAVIAAHTLDTRSRAKTGERWLHYPAQPPVLDWNVPFLQRIPAHQTLEDGQVLPILGGMEVIHTPGHTPGSVCLYLQKHGVLFTGDTLLGDGNRFRRPVAFPGTDWSTFRSSVERLAQLSFETACVGHGKPVLAGGRERLGEMLDDYDWMAPRWDRLRRWARFLSGH